MIFVVEVRAIYQGPGLTVTNQRRNQRNADFDEAESRLAQVGHYEPDPPTEQWLEKLEPGTPLGDRYGFGWRAFQWLNVRQDGDTVGRLVADRLSGRNLNWDSYVQIYEHLRDEDGSDRTGALIFEQRWP